MKKIVSFFITAALMMSGCTLDREPETTLADNNFWKSETDLRGACNKMYKDLPGFVNDFRSDELRDKSQNGISSGNRSVSGTSDDWTDPYNRIGVCNNIIIKSENAQVETGRRNRWVAEAYFFRAYNYFELVKKYGDVPLILKVFNSTSDADVVRARDPRETVIQQCYDDLEFALEWLPDIDDSELKNDWGRVSKSAALGLLVRIGLYEGTHKKYHHTPDGNYVDHLDKGIAAARQLMNSGKHDLYPDFNKLFLHDGEGRQNKENLFVKIYGPAGTINHKHSRQLESSITLTRNMVDNFLYTDGLPREKSPLRIHPESSYADMLKNRDPRLAMTVFTPGEEAYKGSYVPFVTTNQNHAFGYAIKKGYIGSEYSSDGTNDKMIIRYAEVLISYAELLYEKNGSITDDQLDATINKVRERAGFNVRLTNAFVAANGLDMLDEIRRERMVEFIDENLHYDDIIRWKTAEEVLPKAILGLIYCSDETTANYNELKNNLTAEDGTYKGVKVYDQGFIYVLEEAESRSFDPERDYLYPVPTHEISTSGGNITQNPKWGN